MDDVGIHVPHTTDVAAAVNAPTMTTLYDLRGNALQVDSAQVDYFMREHGFTRTKTDVTAGAKDLAPLFDAAKTAIGTWVSGLTETGAIDPHPDAAYQAAVVAMEHLTAQWQRVHTDAHTLFPVVQPKGLTLKSADGAMIEIDPSQRDLYLGQGYNESQETTSVG